MVRLTPVDLENINKKAQEKNNDCIKVGMSTCGIAAGADEVFNVFVEEIKKRELNLEVKKCGCLGMCFVEPLVEVKISGLPRVVYGKVNKEVALKILESHVINKSLVNDHIFEMDFKER